MASVHIGDCEEGFYRAVKEIVTSSAMDMDVYEAWTDVSSVGVDNFVIVLNVVAALLLYVYDFSIGADQSQPILDSVRED